MIDNIIESFNSSAGAYVVESNSTDSDIIKWLDINIQHHEDLLLKHGFILFRGFNLDVISKCEEFVNLTCNEVMFEYGDLPKEKGSKNIYMSTPYPEDRMILYHNEGSHLNSWPTRQFFACVIPSTQGGNTPVVDCRKIYNKLDPIVREKFAQKGLLYSRTFYSYLDVSWQDFYHTNDKNVVEDKIIISGGKFTWDSDGTLTVVQHADAIKKHYQTNESIFFNQIMLHHPHFLDEQLKQIYTSMFKENRYPRNVTFGDGSKIDEEILDDLLNLYNQEAVSFPWQKGDLLMCDNMLVAHARNPFKGERKIIVGLGNPLSSI